MMSTKTGILFVSRSTESHIHHHRHIRIKKCGMWTWDPWKRKKLIITNRVWSMLDGIEWSFKRLTGFFEFIKNWYTLKTEQKFILGSKTSTKNYRRKCFHLAHEKRNTKFNNYDVKPTNNRVCVIINHLKVDRFITHLYILSPFTLLSVMRNNQNYIVMKPRKSSLWDNLFVKIDLN